MIEDYNVDDTLPESLAAIVHKYSLCPTHLSNKKGKKGTRTFAEAYCAENDAIIIWKGFLVIITNFIFGTVLYDNDDNDNSDVVYADVVNLNQISIDEILQRTLLCGASQRL